jgi:two-component system, OmpR family, sensor histidine kinase YxdK
MKLFFREHIPLILFSVLQILLVLLVIWFAGFRNLLILGYAFFLGICVSISYLAFRYIGHSALYTKLSNQPKTLEESIAETNQTPFAIAFDDYLTAQYRQYQQKLALWEEKSHDRITFMNQWVHQMKTPLAVIELITQAEDDPQFESIAEETHRLRKGLEMALYTSRFETFTEDFFIEEVLLFDVVNKVVIENKQFFIRNYVYPEVKIDQSLKVKSDGKWLRFILDQLVTNAIKYSTGTREKITITAFCKKNAITLEIVDRGVGIPATDLSRVYLPFFTGENGRVFKESTGMGLFLVKQVVEKLNHEIRIESVERQGTTVELRFPQ